MAISKTYFKISITFIFFFYLSNILIYYVIKRAAIVENLEKLSQSQDYLLKLKNAGVNFETLKNSTLSTDVAIFNPLFNLGYSFSSWHYWLCSLIVSTTILYLINKRTKNQ